MNRNGFTLSRRSAEHGFTLSRRSAEHGFTLVEMLVALLIFGMLTAAGVSLLSFSVRAQEASERSLGELSQLRRMSALLAADLGQVVPRLHRDEQGQVRAAFVGNPGAGQGIAFVRGGWENHHAAARPDLQRVEYRLEGDRLERRHYAMVDGAPPLDAHALASGVRALRFRYRNGEGAWLDDWAPEDPSALPRAVELLVETERYGSLRQLFLVGAAA